MIDYDNKSIDYDNYSNRIYEKLKSKFSELDKGVQFDYQ